MKNYLSLGLILLTCTASGSLAKSAKEKVCYVACNREVCKISEAKAFCKKHCPESELTNCLKQQAVPAKDMAQSKRQKICYAVFNRLACKNKKVAELAKTMCEPKDIKNCMKAAGMKAE